MTRSKSSGGQADAQRLRRISALDDVRAAETRRLVQDGYQPVLKKTRWCVLKRKANLTTTQRFRLRELLRYNLKTVRAYLLKEDFQQFWEGRASPTDTLTPGRELQLNQVEQRPAGEAAG